MEVSTKLNLEIVNRVRGHGTQLFESLLWVKSRHSFLSAASPLGVNEGQKT
jgi:hypothetical protein